MTRCQAQRSRVASEPMRSTAIAVTGARPSMKGSPRATAARTMTTAAITVTVVLMAAPVVATPSEVSDASFSNEQ